MATAIKKCRVCGKPYEACRTIRNVAGVFRWQEVACSPECGSIYLARIEESRKSKPVECKDEPLLKEVKLAANIEEDEEAEELYDELDEYFDDED